MWKWCASFPTRHCASSALSSYPITPSGDRPSTGLSAMAYHKRVFTWFRLLDIPPSKSRRVPTSTVPSLFPQIHRNDRPARNGGTPQVTAPSFSRNLWHESLAWQPCGFFTCKYDAPSRTPTSHIGFVGVSLSLALARSVGP